MAMVRMTAKEMRKKYPLTSERIKELELLSQKEPDLSDSDNPELDEEFWEKARAKYPRLKTSKVAV
jgi:predicted Zn-dependent protease